MKAGYFFSLVLFVGLTGFAAADDSATLLQSWGFDRDTNGELVYQRREASEATPDWKPDEDVFKQPEPAPSQPATKPVVIRAGGQ